MTRSIVLQTVNLGKVYSSLPALTDVSLQVEAGEVFGLLGPNGAGKSTLLRLLMGLLSPTTGRATIFGLDCTEQRVALKRKIGFLPDAPSFYDYLSGSELLRFVGQMHGLSTKEVTRRSEALLDELKLSDAANDYAMDYSFGMKKRMGLALALIHEPTVLILDEPTTGLDPLATKAVCEKIKRWAAAGGTVILSTHWVQMAERLCDRVAILDRGQTLAVGSVVDLQAKGGPSSHGHSLEDLFFQLTARA